MSERETAPRFAGIGGHRSHTAGTVEWLTPPAITSRPDWRWLWHAEIEAFMNVKDIGAILQRIDEFEKVIR